MFSIGFSVLMPIILIVISIVILAYLDMFTNTPQKYFKLVASTLAITCFLPIILLFEYAYNSEFIIEATNPVFIKNNIAYEVLSSGELRRLYFNVNITENDTIQHVYHKSIVYRGEYRTRLVRNKQIVKAESSIVDE